MFIILTLYVIYIIHSYDNNPQYYIYIIYIYYSNQKCLCIAQYSKLVFNLDLSRV